jgi:hypothetical protein
MLMTLTYKVLDFKKSLLKETSNLEEARRFYEVCPIAIYCEVYSGEELIKSITTMNDLRCYIPEPETVPETVPKKERIRTKVANPIRVLPDKNLKTLAAVGKAKLSDVPPVALYALGAAMSDGASKYGRFNWRETGATSSVFFDAMMRHLLDWYAGENHAPDSKVHHLAHLMASCAILLDAELQSCLNDDRSSFKQVGLSRSEKFWKEKN